MERRERIVEAILLVVADSGLKGLTHRAIDKRAGLAEGSTGNVFPRRDDLIRAILRRLEERDIASFAEANAGTASTPAELAALLAHGIVRMLGSDEAADDSTDVGALTRVRFTMMLAYPEETAEAHRRLLRILERVMTRTGADRVEARARDIAASFDGYLLHALSVDPRPVDADAVARALLVLLTG